MTTVIKVSGKMKEIQMNHEPMTVKQFREFLTEAIENEAADPQGATATSGFVHACWSFIEYGMLTSDEGLVVKMTDGTEFAVTVQLRRSMPSVVIRNEPEPVEGPDDDDDDDFEDDNDSDDDDESEE